MPKTMMIGKIGAGALAAATPSPVLGSPPSSYAIYDLVTGVPGALPRTIGLTAVRSIFIAPGLYLAGVRGWTLVKGSLLASAFISLGMIGLCAWKARCAVQLAAQQPPDPMRATAAPPSAGE